jgi:hypothetical protein
MADIEKDLEGLRAELDRLYRRLWPDAFEDKWMQGLAHLEAVEMEIARLCELVGQYQRAQDLDMGTHKKLVVQRDSLRSALEEARSGLIEGNLHNDILNKLDAALSHKGEDNE